MPAPTAITQDRAAPKSSEWKRHKVPPAQTCKLFNAVIAIQLAVPGKFSEHQHSAEAGHQYNENNYHVPSRELQLASGAFTSHQPGISSTSRTFHEN